MADAPAGSAADGPRAEGPRADGPRADGPAAGDGAPRPRPPRRRIWVRRIGIPVVAVVVTVGVFRLLGRFDWGDVLAALTHLSWWQPLVLLALLVVRQGCSAAPLAFHIPGVSAYRATVNDLGALTMSAFAPAPSDMVLRVAMFASWGFDVSKASAGTVMNALTLFIVRFSTPIAGFVVVAATGGPLGVRWIDVLSILTAAALVVGLVLTVRTEGWARWIGTTLGRAVRLVRREVDPDAWAGRIAGFRTDLVAGFRRAFPRGVVAVCAMVACDIVMVTLALRFVGVTPEEAPLAAIAVAFLFAYPLTCFPMQGLGVVDVLLLASLVESCGPAVREPAVAALIIWRVFTVAGPLLLGLGAVSLWRRDVRRARRAAVG